LVWPNVKELFQAPAIEVIDGDIQYWRDEKLVHHVPSQELEEMKILSNK